MRLYLIRHPQPFVSAGICYGSSDVGVDTQDLDQVLQALTRPSMMAGSAAAPAQSAAVDSATSLPKGIALYSSPLRRCADLARRLASALNGAVPTFDERLAEMHFGHWELRHWDDIPRSEVDAWAANLTAYRPGGGESVLHMAKRVQAFYLDVVRKQQDAIVVCHAGTIRIMLACQHSGNLDGIALHAARDPIKIAYGQVMVLDVV